MSVSVTHGHVNHMCGLKRVYSKVCVVPFVSQALDVLQVVSFVGYISIISLGIAQFWCSYDQLYWVYKQNVSCIMPLHLVTSEFLRVMMDFYSYVLDLAFWQLMVEPHGIKPSATPVRFLVILCYLQVAWEYFWLVTWQVSCFQLCFVMVWVWFVIGIVYLDIFIICLLFSFTINIFEQWIKFITNIRVCIGVCGIQWTSPGWTLYGPRWSHEDFIFTGASMHQGGRSSSNFPVIFLAAYSESTKKKILHSYDMHVYFNWVLELCEQP